MTEKSFPKMLKNEKGMTIPLVMILATVGALIVLSMSQTVMNSVGLTSNRNSIVTYESFVENLKNVIEEPTACTVMLKGTRVNLGLNAVSQVPILNRDFDDTVVTNRDITPGWEDPEKAFGVDRMEIQMLAAESDHVTERAQKKYDHDHYATLNDAALAPTLEPAIQYAYPARFVLHPSGIQSRLLNDSGEVSRRFQKWEVDSAGNPVIDSTTGRPVMKINPATGKPFVLDRATHTAFEDDNSSYLEKGRIDVRIFVNVEPIGGNEGIIRSCYGYKSDASVCAASGGTYQYEEDPDDPFPEMRCKPYKKCFAAKVGLVDSPSACPDPFKIQDGAGNYLYTKTVGKINGADKFLCNWCHPYADTVKDLQTTIGNLTEEDWLEKEWKRLAAEVSRLMPLAPNPLDLPDDLSDAERDELNRDIGELAMEWTVLENTTIQSGLALDTQSEEYLEVQAAHEELQDLKFDKVAKQDDINNLNMEVEDLEDELDAIKRANRWGISGASQSDVDEAQARLDAAQAAYEADASPANQTALADAQSDYDSVYALHNDPDIERTIETQLNTARSELSQAQDDMRVIDANLATAQSNFDNIQLSSGQSASEFLDPINAVKTMLVTEYGIDESAIEWMDEARGL